MKKIALGLLVLVLLTSWMWCGYDVEKQGSIKWNVPSGIKVHKTFSGFYGVNDFQVISNNQVAILATENNQIRVYSFGGSFLYGINLPQYAEDLLFYKNNFFVRVDNKIYQYDNAGNFVNSFEISHNIKFVQKLAYVGDILYVLTANEKSYPIAENFIQILPSEQENNLLDGWIMREHTIMKSIKLDEHNVAIRFYMNDNFKEIPLYFDNRVASAVVLGMSNRNIFLNVEFIESDSPIKVNRKIVRVSLKPKKMVDIIDVPNIYYVYTKNDIQIINDDIFELISTPESLDLLKLKYVEGKSTTIYPEEYKYTYHYNDHLPAILEGDNLRGNIKDENPIHRSEILANADQYISINWTASSSNISNGVVQTPDGAYIRTPSWVTVGSKQKVPYKWGGFTSISTFTTKIAAGAYAGDNYTSSVSWSDNYCVGVDCSGFVSRSWDLSHKYGTSTLPSISTAHSSLSNLKRGDILNYSGHHVRLCVEDNPNGTVNVAEAAGADWRVSYRTFNFSSLSSYQPRYFNLVQEDDNPSANGTFVVQVKSWKGDLNVRTGPGTSYSTITKIHSGEKYVAFDYSNGWYKIYLPHGTNHDYGWTYGGTTTDNGYLEGSQNSAMVEVKSWKGTLNVRSGPSTSYGVITTITTGQKFVVVSSSNGWYKFYIAGVSGHTTGWASGSYLVYHNGGSQSPYGASVVSLNGPSSLESGETGTFTIKVKNTGISSWDSNTILATSNPHLHNSVFPDGTWISQSKVMSATKKVLPGQEYTFSFKMTAPTVSSTTTKTEYFNLEQDGYAWFSDNGQNGPNDTDIHFSISVSPSASQLAFTSSPVTSGTENTAYYYDAQCNLESKNDVDLSGKVIIFKGKVTNILDDTPLSGVEIWVENRGIVAYTNENGEYEFKAPINSVKYIKLQKKGFIGMTRMLYTDGMRKQYQTMEMILTNPNDAEERIIEEKLNLQAENTPYHIHKLSSDEKITSIPDKIRVLMTDGTVVEMDMDEYLKGVVPKEVSPSWPMEALKAQAMAARSYAATTHKHTSVGADVCTTTHCQAWGPTHYNSTDQAVDATHKGAIKYNGSVINSVFFGHCIGHTKNSEDVWGGYVAYLRSVNDNCTYSSYYGHGVGMCQVGTKLFAQQGWTFDQILTHYYTGVTIDVANPTPTFTYSIVSGPSWLSINSQTGEISGTPNNANVGTTHIKLKVEDSNGNVAYQEYDLTISNVAPTITSTPSQTTLNAGETFQYNVESDQEGIGGTSYSLVSSPSWLSINASTGLISGTTQAGNYTIKVKCDDNHGGVDYQQFNLTVNNPSIAVINVSPSSVETDLIPDDSKTINLTISNTGTIPLNYTITKASKNDTKNVKHIDNSFVPPQLPKNVADNRHGQDVVRGSGGPDAAGYKWKDSNSGAVYSWVEIKNIGTKITNWTKSTSFAGEDEGYYGPINLNFNFDFYGSNFNNIYVSSNGFLTNAPITYNTYTNYSLPSSANPNPMIAAFWDDLDGSDGSGNVYYYVTNQYAVIEFDNWKHYGNSAHYTFEIILYKSGNIVFQYKDVENSGHSETIGIENYNGSTGLQVAYNTSYLANNLAIIFYHPTTTNGEWLTFTPSSGSVSANGTNTITLTFNSAGYSAGTNLTATLNISSNANNNSSLNIPITLHVIQDNSNHAPVITSYIPSTTNVAGLMGVNINFSVSVSDQDGDNLSYAWYVDNSYQANTSSFSKIFGAAGNYIVKVIVKDTHNASTSMQWNVDISQISTFAENFEGNLDGWTKTENSLWHVSNVRKYEGSYSICYNNGSNYNTGSANSGDLYSPEFVVPTSSSTLTFNSWYKTEDESGTYDKKLVYISTDGGSTWTQIYQIFGAGTSNHWQEINIDLSTYQGQNVKLMFRFNSVDGWYNDYEGWYIDNIRFTNNSPTFAANDDFSDGGERLHFRNGLTKLYPNPFNPEITINYQVNKDAAIKLSIFDVNGNLVKTLFSGVKNAGRYSMKWNGVSNNGTKVASGIYFVKMVISGEVIDIQRIVLMK